MAASVSAARASRPIRLLEVTGRRGAQESSMVAYQPGCPLLRGDGDSAPVLWSDIGKSLREGPMMAGEILGRILPLAVLELGRLHQDAGAVATGPLAVREHVVDPHHHCVGDLPGSRWTTIVSYVADDHGPLAPDAHLGAMRLADADPF